MRDRGGHAAQRRQTAWALGPAGLLLLLAGCEGTTPVASPSPTPPVYGDYAPHPEPPSILRDVALIDDEVEFVGPFVPGHRTSMDGRVALRVQGGPPGTETLRRMLSFSLFVPEALEQPIMSGPAGAAILAGAEPFDVVFPPALDPSVSRLGHHAICDPTEEFPQPGERPNPYVCGPDGADDCYRLTIVSTTSAGADSQVWGTEAIVQVADPKTPLAQIVAVELGTPVAGAVIPRATEWTEPAVTSDGRLLTGRFGRAPRSWTDPRTGESRTGFYDLAYAVLPEDAAPCDVTGWVDFHPMSYAPYDPQMEGYGLAAWPFRDSEGNAIPAGEDLGGTYPWVDREGANVFMAAVQGRIAEQSEADWPRRCVHEGCEEFEENYDWDRGFLVAGLWTHGKFVHLDGMLNSIDWAVGVTPAAHYLVDLYQEPDGSPVPVRFGAGRFIDRVRNEGGPYPFGYTHNANIVDSLQNVFTWTDVGRPVRPRDVVWVMSSGVATDEVVFDEFLDPNAFIVSNMQASVTQFRHPTTGLGTALPVHHNGQLRVNDLGLPVAQVNELVPDATTDIHLQNAATSPGWAVPAFGRVEAGQARVEPVALGGVEGRGFWLSGETEISYAVPAQPPGGRSVEEPDWYLGIFLDPRAAAGEMRALFSFPDGTEIHADGHGRVRYLAQGVVLHEAALPQPDASGWLHLGLRIEAGQRSHTLLHNGYAWDHYQSDQPLFRMGEGRFAVAPQDGSVPGWRGWIDNLLVLAHDVDPEVACNHAGGTLLAVDDHAEWTERAARYPDWAHREVATAAGRPAGTFACYHDYSGDYRAHLASLPEGTHSLREAITFPEGPVRYGQPRPDSADNAFCLSCHTAEGRGGLGLEALVADPGLNAEHDPRRQPMQPPRRVFGHIPARWIPAGAGPGSPSEASVAPPEGALIDAWVLPQP